MAIEIYNLLIYISPPTSDYFSLGTIQIYRPPILVRSVYYYYYSY